MKLRSLESTLEGSVAVRFVYDGENEAELWYGNNGLNDCPDEILDREVDTMTGIYDGDFAGIAIYLK